MGIYFVSVITISIFKLNIFFSINNYFYWSLFFGIQIKALSIILASYFPKGSYCTLFKHSKNYIHSSKISIKNSLIFPRSSSFYTSKASTSNIIPINRSSIIPFHNKSQTFFTSTSLSEESPWRFIPKAKNMKPSRGLRLIVHGSAGGYIHPLVHYIIEHVEHLRGSFVDIEILTQERPKYSRSSSIWLVPLLLLPGKHVQNDIPKIYKRLINEGINTQLLPFLGCWHDWISILKYIIDLESKDGEPILLHHPLNNDIGSNYLNQLRQKLKVQVLPWTKWNELNKKEDKKFSPIPFSLAPNQNTKHLRQHDSISSLLEIDILLIELINILTHLP